MVTDTTKGGLIQRRVLRSTLSNYIGKIVTLGAGFFLTPFMVHRLGAAEYGLWVLVGSVVGYGALLDFGIGTAVTKYIAEYRAKGQTEQARSLVATALCLYTVLGFVAIALGALLAPLFPRLFTIPLEEHGKATRLVLLSGLSLGLSIPAAITSAALWGLQRFDLANLLGILGTLLSTLVTVFILVQGGDVVAVVAAGIVITVLMQAPAVWLIHRIAPELRLGWYGASRELVRTVVSFSSSLFVINVAGRLHSKTDEIVIGASMPMTAVTPYALAHRLSELARILTEQFMKVLLPLASELHAENDQARLRALYIISTRLTLAIFVPIGCVVVVLAGPLLQAWVGPDYIGYAPLVLILTLAGLVDISAWPAGFVLQGMSRHHRLAAIAIGSGLANLVLSLLLVRPLGLTGVALGTLIPATAESLIFVLPYTWRVMGLGLREALSDIFLPAFLPAAPLLIVLYAVQSLIAPSSLLSLAVVASLAFIVYLLTYLSLKVNTVERKTYRSLASSARRLTQTYLRRL